jgi:hypothetical protein
VSEQQRSKDMSGAIFKNDRKELPNHPDRKGSAVIGGVDYWVAGWLKEDKNGQQYLSLAFTRKDEKTAAKAEPCREPKADSAW